MRRSIAMNKLEHQGKKQGALEAVSPDGSDQCAPLDRRNPELPDRRSDTFLAELVQRGVDLHMAAGHVAARSYMLRVEVPHHIRLRVLAGPSFRRNPRWSSMRKQAVQWHEKERRNYGH